MGDGWSLREGPPEATPDSGYVSIGPMNRGKLIKHLRGSITCLEHSLRHARRALARAEGEARRDDRWAADPWDRPKGSRA